jgi:hypothetical protein
MPVTTFEGPPGSGKSLSATALAYTEHAQNGRRVFANYGLNFPYTHLDPEYIADNLKGDELTNGVAILDEAVLMLDSRTSGKKSVRLFANSIVMQARHRDLELYICTQHIDMVEKRTRRVPGTRGTCRYYEEDPCRICLCSMCKGTGVVDGGLCPKCVPSHEFPNKGMGATGITGKRDGICLTCHGLGFIPQLNADGTVCKVCMGTGEGPGCKRCLGYGKTGWATTTFYDFARNKHKSIRVFGPAFWGLYDTKQQFLPTSGAMKIPVEDLT